MTWKLWYALQHPLHTPLFQRVYQSRTRSGRLRRILQIGLMYLVLCSLLTLLWPLLLTDLPITLAVILFVSNNLAGMTWADRVSLTVAKENEQATFDLLCLIPVGQLGVIWSLSTASLHASHIFRGMRFFMRVLFTGVVGGLMIFLIISGVLTYSSEMDWRALLVPLVYMITLTVAFYLDYVQAVITATIIGMLTAIDTPHRTYSRILAVSGFLLFQVSIYTLTVIISFVGLNHWLRADTPHSTLLLGSIPALRLLIFYLLHEAVIILLWQALLRRANGHTRSLQQLSGHGSG